MPVPKRRTSKRKKNMRRSHDGLTAPQWGSCPKCGEALFPHRACSNCGTYRGKSVLPTEAT
jgi:large subunit ribosomal protein L32